MGLDMPVHSEALRAGGETFLTQAFRAAGSLAGDNRVTRITGLKEIAGGSTGRKALLSVEYEKQLPGLHTELFVKFSRALDDEVRDQTKVQMELEVLFALLSRHPAFPIRVPVCYFSDYHHESGTGILITQRIAYNAEGNEPHYPKCLDHRMPDPPAHYRALVRALARLAGTHKAGRLPDIVETYFPFDLGKLVVSKRAAYTPEQVSERVVRYADFAQKHPHLLPANIRSAGFLARLAREAPRLQARKEVVLLGLFVHEFQSCGGPALDVATLKEHLTLYTAMMGINWMLDVPQTVAKRVPALDEVRDRRDSRIDGDERARSQLVILTAFLNLWEKTDMARVLADLDSISVPRL